MPHAPLCSSWFSSSFSLDRVFGRRERAANRKQRQSTRPGIEALEDRIVPIVFNPSQIRGAYGINLIQFGSAGAPVTGNGAGQTIAIIDPGDDPNMAADLQSFDSLYTTAKLNLSTFGSFTGQVVNGQPWFHQVANPGSNPDQYDMATEQSLSRETS